MVNVSKTTLSLAVAMALTTQMSVAAPQQPTTQLEALTFKADRMGAKNSTDVVTLREKTKALPQICVACCKMNPPSVLAVVMVLLNLSASVAWVIMPLT